MYRKHDDLNRDNLVPNLRDHGRESIGETLVSVDVYERSMLAFDVLWVGWLVDNGTRYAVGEF
jgi:hypothetical protein